VDQERKPYLEGGAEGAQDIPAGVAAPALEEAHLALPQFRPLGKLLLGQVTSFALLPYRNAESAKPHRLDGF
jgi:hypothetical protein